jgi:hypothetical protein
MPETRKAHRILVWKSRREEIRRIKRMWDYDIKIDHKEIDSEDVEWVNLA